ncbi:hypothetical protein EYC84_009245 [Monilinia fructicola]|uniref:AMMECR1 domain-containing protein n=1 Tax=Monilinia fructicola TaxID=38448 RepID=A0A5M9JEC8_MONFR|nr:hypothetical protein EYC84_009245 [Monilinia fructicola]
MATPDHCLYCFEVLTAYHEEKTFIILGSCTKIMEIISQRSRTSNFPRSGGRRSSNTRVSPQIHHQHKSKCKHKYNTNTSTSRHPIIQRITRSTSGTSTPSSSSSSDRTSTSTSTNDTTPPAPPHPSPPSASPRPQETPPTPHNSQPSRMVLPPLRNLEHHIQQQPPTSKLPTLRGCIGTFSSEPIVTSLKEYALTSALTRHALLIHHPRGTPHARSSRHSPHGLRNVQPPP